jgi:hypothetical protein
MYLYGSGYFYFFVFREEFRTWTSAVIANARARTYFENTFGSVKAI